MLVVSSTLIAELFVLNGLKRNDPELILERSERYDRFNGSSKFIGNGKDWSGVGLRSFGLNDAVGSGSTHQFATLVSPSFYISAIHFHSGVGSVVRFYYANDPTQFVDRTVEAVWPMGDDVLLGKLSEPVPAGITCYPIMVVEDPQDYVGTELWIVGQSNLQDLVTLGVVSAESEFINEALRQRVGRNIVSSVEPVKNIDGIVIQDNVIRFEFQASLADVAGPDMTGTQAVMGGDGIVDEFDIDFIDANDGLPMPSYIAGDLDGNGEIGPFDGGEWGIRNGELQGTDALGWDEAFSRDSSGPSFMYHNGMLVLVGAHSRATDIVRNRINSPIPQATATNPDPPTYVGGLTIDASTGAKFDEIADRIQLEVGDSEHVASVSYSRQFVLGSRRYELPAALAKLKVVSGDLNGDGLLDHGDINILVSEIKMSAANPNRCVNLGFDLNNDSMITDQDLKTLLERDFKTFLGDLNLDGDVDVLGPSVDDPGDGFTLLENQGMSVSTYAEADLNADGIVDIFDDGFPLVNNVGKTGLLFEEPDINDDGVLDAAEVNELASGTSGGGAVGIDYNEDGVIDDVDFEYFLANVLNTTNGDFNLNGKLEFLGEPNEPPGDGQILLSNLNQPGSFEWSDGDLDGDGQVTNGDVMIFQALLTAAAQ